MSKRKAVRRNSRNRKPINQEPPVTLADHFKAAFGWVPSRQRFRTTANLAVSAEAVTPSSPVVSSTYPSYRAGQISTCGGRSHQGGSCRLVTRTPPGLDGPRGASRFVTTWSR